MINENTTDNRPRKNALVLFIAAALPGPFIRKHVEVAREADEIELTEEDKLVLNLL